MLNHWWQTETGHSITASCLGFGHNLKPPMFSAGMPFPGYDGNIAFVDNAYKSFYQNVRVQNIYKTINFDFGKTHVNTNCTPIENINK